MAHNMNPFETYRIMQEWADISTAHLSEAFKSTLAYHDELNSKFWSNNELKKEVKAKLLEIAHAWAEFSLIPKKAIKDIFLVGGNANYNYTEFSDLDLHLIVDKSEIADCPDLLDDYLQDKKQLWSLTHKVSIYDQPVELYAQDVSTKTPAGQGAYSVMNGKWVTEPRRKEINLKDPLIKQKVKDLIEKIDYFIVNKADDLSLLNGLKNRIREMRSSAILKGGEFAVENLVFKELRNLGYLDKLSSYIRNIEDKRLSI